MNCVVFKHENKANGIFYHWLYRFLYTFQPLQWKIIRYFTTFLVECCIYKKSKVRMKNGGNKNACDYE